MIKSIFSGRMLSVFLMGFSSGLPLVLIGGTLKAWMKDQSIDITVIGLFALVGLPYSLKFLWSPFMDRFQIPLFGRRRGWLLLTQVALMIGLWILSGLDPAKSEWTVALMAFVLAFLGASQDIVIDAYRREVLSDEELGLGSGLYIASYRVAYQFVGGSLALILADHIDWGLVYKVMAALMLVGLLTTLFSPEPSKEISLPKSITEAVVYPFIEFFERLGWVGLTILAFILLYKIGDTMASELTIPYYLDIGFTKTQIGAIGKTVGLAGFLGGGLLGGLVVLKIGINRSLWIFGFFQCISTACFAFLVHTGPSLPALAGVIGFETISGGMGGSAYIAFMQALTNRKFTATQYALLSSLMAVPRSVAAAPTGWIVEYFGWQNFFILCSLMAIPGILLLSKVAPWNTRLESSNSLECET